MVVSQQSNLFNGGIRENNYVRGDNVGRRCQVCDARVRAGPTAGMVLCVYHSKYTQSNTQFLLPRLSTCPLSLDFNGVLYTHYTCMLDTSFRTPMSLRPIPWTYFRTSFLCP